MAVLEQSPYAVLEARYHGVAPGKRREVVDANGAVENNPEISGVFHLVGDRRGLQHGLGGDAATVEAHSPQMGAFHDGHAHAQLGRPQGGHVPARTGADYG